MHRNFHSREFLCDTVAETDPFEPDPECRKDHYRNM